MFQQLLSQRRFYQLLYILGGLAIFAGCWLSLWDQDESAYAGFAWQMIKSGDWLVPEFPWSEIHRKTPLYFWSISLSNLVFGYSEWAVRLPAMLSIVATSLWLGWQGQRVFGKDTARVAALILLANIFLPHLAKIAVTDAQLLFFETMAVLALLNFFKDGKASDRWWFVLGVAGALLVKGPPVLILTVGILGLLLLFHPDKKRWLQFHPWFLFPLAAIPLLIWGRLAWQTDDGVFIRWMIDWYTFSRVGGEVLGQTGPPGYYLMTLLLAFLPWTWLFPKAFGQLFRPFVKKESQFADKALLFWLISGWLIYELMRSKLPAYVIGAYPAMSLLLAKTALTIVAGDFRKQWLLKIGLGLYVLLVLALAIAVPIAVKPLVTGQAYAWSIVLAAALIISLLWIGLQAWNSRYNRMITAIFLQCFGFLLVVWLLIMPGLEPMRGATKQLAQTADSNVSKEYKVYFTRNFQLPTLPYYFGKYGFSYADVYVAEDWKKLLQPGEKSLLVFNQEDWQQFIDLGIPHRVLHQQKGWISDRGLIVDWYLVVAE